MEWSRLKAEERCWDLSPQQKMLLAERVYQSANQPRTFYFPIFKPLLVTAAVAVLLLGLMILWPKKPMHEQVVVLPGSSEAKPGDYVEKSEESEEPSGDKEPAEDSAPAVEQEDDKGESDPHVKNETLKEEPSKEENSVPEKEEQAEGEVPPVKNEAPKEEPGAPEKEEQAEEKEPPVKNETPKEETTKEENSAPEKGEQVEESDQPSKEEGSDEKTPAVDQEKEEPSKEELPAVDQEKEPADDGTASQPQESEFAKALPIVKEKAHRKKFNNALTKEQREALSVYLSRENQLYLQGQISGDISAYKESGTKQYLLDLTLFTTKEAVGKDLAEKEIKMGDEALSPIKIDKRVLDVTELGVVRNHYPRLLNKEIDTPADYLQNLSLNQVVPEGRMRLQLKLNHGLAQSEVQDLVEHFLRNSNVTWLELSYHTEEDHSNPTAIRRFWESEKEMTVEEADAIMTEKIKRRPEEKLSDRERMAFYKVFSAETDQLISYYIEEDRLDTFDIMMKIITGSEYNDLDFQSCFQQLLNEPDAEVDIGEMKEASESMEVYTKISRVYSPDIPNLSWLEDEHEIAYMRNGGKYVSVSLDLNHSNIEERGQYLKQFIKHSLSLDCASAVSVMFIYGSYLGKVH